MKIPCYLAMTAIEFSSVSPLPPHPAWMACHFSPYDSGLTNLPPKLPEGTMLILNDRTPIQHHDPLRVSNTLRAIVEKNSCSSILLDFQIPDCPQVKPIIESILSLPCPVAVSHLYAKEYSCPVFLPLCPLTIPVSEHITPWLGREIWLEVAPQACLITVTEAGTTFEERPYHQNAYQHQDPELFCRYDIQTERNRICFSLCRNPNDIVSLLHHTKDQGVTKAISLWQDFHPK